MKDKIKWFGRYLGCNSVWIGSKTKDVISSDIVTCDNFKDLIPVAPNRKLVLKKTQGYK